MADVHLAKPLYGVLFDSLVSSLPVNLLYMLLRNRLVYAVCAEYTAYFELYGSFKYVDPTAICAAINIIFT